MFRWGLRLVLLVATGLVAYVAVVFVQVWLTSRRDQARPVAAIVVMGAAQYNGRPSPVLQARLDHARALWNRHLAPVVVVTGGAMPGDRTTEASASADYLAAAGVPQSALLREVQGRNSWQSLQAAAAFLKQQGGTTVLLVSDPFHEERIRLMAADLGLTALVSPTRTSPIRGTAVLPHLVKESVEVALGRVFGFGRLSTVGQRVRGAVGSGSR